MKPFLNNLSKVTVAILAVLLLSPKAGAQSTNSVPEKVRISELSKRELRNARIASENTVTDVESFRNWLDRKLEDQLSEMAKKGTGNVIVNFAVTEKGKVTDIKIISSTDTDVNRVVIKLLSESPQWRIKQLQNDPYKIYYSVPISYDVK